MKPLLVALKRTRGGVLYLEVDNVAVLHDISLPFLAVLASCFDLGIRRLGRERLVVIISADFGLDEAFFKVTDGTFQGSHGCSSGRGIRYGRRQWTVSFAVASRVSGTHV